MLKVLTARFRRFSALIRRAVWDPSLDISSAAVIILPALGWQLGKGLVGLMGYAETLVLWVVTAASLIVLGAVVFGVGAVVWLIIVLVISLVRGRLSGETKPGQAWPAIVLALGGLFFFGVPELCEKLAWWQEKLFSQIPNEPATLDACRVYFSDRDTILGLIILAPIGYVFFLYVRRKAPEPLQRAGSLLKGLTTRRDWRAPAILAIAIILTIVALAVYHLPGWSSAIVFLELAALFVWLFLPLIRQHPSSILVPIPCLVPVVLAIENFRGKSPILSWLLVLAIIWTCWVFLPKSVRVGPWRIAFWAFTFAITGCLFYASSS